MTHFITCLGKSVECSDREDLISTLQKQYAGSIVTLIYPYERKSRTATLYVGQEGDFFEDESKIRAYDLALFESSGELELEPR